MRKQFATNMYEQLTVLTEVTSVFAVGTGFAFLICIGSFKMAEWVQKSAHKQAILLAKYDGEQEKAVWEALRAKYGD